MYNFLDSTEYIVWTMGISMLGLHLCLAFSLNFLTVVIFLFMVVYASLLMAQSQIKRNR